VQISSGAVMMMMTTTTTAPEGWRGWGLGGRTGRLEGQGVNHSHMWSVGRVDIWKPPSLPSLLSSSSPPHVLLLLFLLSLCSVKAILYLCPPPHPPLCAVTLTKMMMMMVAAAAAAKTNELPSKNKVSALEESRLPRGDGSASRRVIKAQWIVL